MPMVVYLEKKEKTASQGCSIIRKVYVSKTHIYNARIRLLSIFLCFFKWLCKITKKELDHSGH